MTPKNIKKNPFLAETALAEITAALMPFSSKKVLFNNRKGAVYSIWNWCQNGCELTLSQHPFIYLGPNVSVWASEWHQHKTVTSCLIRGIRLKTPTFPDLTKDCCCLQEEFVASRSASWSFLQRLFLEMISRRKTWGGVSFISGQLQWHNQWRDNCTSSI